MPKTLLGEKYKVKAPPIDYAWGAVLARQKDLHMDLSQLAILTGYHYDTIRKAWTTHPIDWSPDLRASVMKALGLKATLVVEDAGK